MALKLGMLHRVNKYYLDCSNYDLELTLTFFTARSNLLSDAFILENART